MSDQQTEVIPEEWATSIVPGMAPDELAPAAGPAVAPSFDVVLRGYERHQVDGHLSGLTQRVEQLRADLELARSRELAALQEVSRAKAELERGRPTFDSLGERVAQMLGLAEAEAAAMREAAGREAFLERENASKAAATMRSDAEHDAERTLASSRVELSDLQRRRGQLLADISAMRDAMDQLLADREPATDGVDLRDPEVLASRD